MDIEKMNEIKQISDECFGEVISDSDDEGETYQERDVNIYKNMYDLIIELKKELDDHKLSLDNSLINNEELRLENLSLKKENTSSACLYVISKENEKLKETIEKYKERYGGLSL